MRKFIIKSLSIMSVLLVLMVFSDILLTKFLKNNHEYPGEIEVWNDIFSSKINADIAIYGSSRAWVHFSPQILDDSLKMRAYNFGIDGHNFWLQYLRSKEYLKYNKRPKLIIMSVDIFTLAKRGDLYEPTQFLPFMFWNSDFKEYLSSYDGFSSEDFYIPLVRYYGHMKDLNLSLDNNIKRKYRDRGYKAQDKSWNQDFENAKAKAKSMTIQIDKNSVSLFNRFLEESQANGIKVILVYAPEHIDGQKFVTNRNDIVTLFERTAKEHHITFLNYSDDDLCQEKKFFYNASHLNKIGSEIFTAKLSSDLKRQLTN